MSSITFQFASGKLIRSTKLISIRNEGSGELFLNKSNNWAIII